MEVTHKSMKSKIVITTEYLFLINEESKITENDYVLFNNLACPVISGKEWRIPKGLMFHYDCHYKTITKDEHKIIAYLPLQESAKKLNLPLLPKTNLLINPINFIITTTIIDEKVAIEPCFEIIDGKMVQILVGEYTY